MGKRKRVLSETPPLRLAPSFGSEPKLRTVRSLAPAPLSATAPKTSAQCGAWRSVFFPSRSLKLRTVRSLVSAAPPGHSP